MRYTTKNRTLEKCETLWSAREIASVAPSAKRERRSENVFHMLSRVDGKRTSMKFSSISSIHKESARETDGGARALAWSERTAHTHRNAQSPRSTSYRTM